MDTRLAVDPELDHDARRVLLFMLGKLDYENHIRVAQSDIARRLQIDKSRVSRAVARLRSRGVLRPTEKVGRSTFYVLDPDYGWKGKVRNRARLSGAM